MLRLVFTKKYVENISFLCKKTYLSYAINNTEQPYNLYRCNCAKSFSFRTIVQSAKQLSFAFLGSQASLLSEMFSARLRPFFQAAKIIQLGPIDRRSLKSYIRRRYLSVGIKVDKIEEVLNLVEGHPDYTQRYCSLLYDIVTASGESPPTIELDESLYRQGLDAMIGFYVLPSGLK